MNIEKNNDNIERDDGVRILWYLGSFCIYGWEMKDYETDKNSIWKSEIFGRSLEQIVKEGIEAKLAMMPETARFKLANTVTKIVNKGANNLIAIVI